MRILLFKLFNKWETWQTLQLAHNSVSASRFDPDSLSATLDAQMRAKRTIYSAAYIMPAIRDVAGGRKHVGHLHLVARMLADEAPARISQASGLNEVYRILLAYPGLGPFLAFQYTIDLNYSELVDFQESDFVVAGPGARDGIAKCFVDPAGYSAEDLIRWTCDRQAHEFERRGLSFAGLFGRSLQLVDCQNLFCEVDKYARVRHPDSRGTSGRTRIKQSYSARAFTPMPRAFFPPKWGLQASVSKFYSESQHDGSL